MICKKKNTPMYKIKYADNYNFLCNVDGFDFYIHKRRKEFLYTPIYDSLSPTMAPFKGLKTIVPFDKKSAKLFVEPHRERLLKVIKLAQGRKLI
jgi:hypothetical protein